MGFGGFLETPVQHIEVPLYR